MEERIFCWSHVIHQRLLLGYLAFCLITLAMNCFLISFFDLSLFNLELVVFWNNVFIFRQGRQTTLFDLVFKTMLEVKRLTLLSGIFFIP